MANLAIFKPDPAGVAAFAESAGMTAAMAAVAAEGVALAKQYAAPHRVTGAFEASITSEAQDGKALIVADDEAAVWIEFGTNDTEGLHVMGRVATELGGD